MTLTVILLTATIALVLITIAFVLALFAAIAEMSERIDALWTEVIEDEPWDL